MYIHTVSYEDYNGVKRTEDLMFNIARHELTEFQFSVAGGLAPKLSKMVKEQDATAIMSMFTDIIRRAYGKKSEDGKRFMKSEEIYREFLESPAYEVFFDEITNDTNVMNEFIAKTFPNKDAQGNVINMPNVNDIDPTKPIADQIPNLPN